MVFSDMIISGKNDHNEVEKYLGKITSSSKRMQLLINNLLQFSRQPVNSADFVNVDLGQLVKEAIIEIELEIEKNQAEINISLLPTLPAVPALMRQLFYNLISNAIKFKRKENFPIVNISCERIPASDLKTSNKYVENISYYRISVSDNGIGFDEKYAEDIFLVFKRLHSYHEFEGTGVGLSICKKIIDKHNGFITAHNNVDAGATFVLELPEKQIN
jgi:light-regulated signal transduction histidine kinase (bacteriophytochrome)